MGRGFKGAEPVPGRVLGVRSSGLNRSPTRGLICWSRRPADRQSRGFRNAHVGSVGALPASFSSVGSPSEHAAAAQTPLPSVVGAAEGHGAGCGRLDSGPQQPLGQDALELAGRRAGTGSPGGGRRARCSLRLFPDVRTPRPSLAVPNPCSASRNRTRSARCSWRPWIQGCSAFRRRCSAMVWQNLHALPFLQPREGPTASSCLDFPVGCLSLRALMLRELQKSWTHIKVSMIQILRSAEALVRNKPTSLPNAKGP